MATPTRAEQCSIAMAPSTPYLVVPTPYCSRCSRKVTYEDDGLYCTVCHLWWEDTESDPQSYCDEFGEHDRTWCWKPATNEWGK